MIEGTNYRLVCVMAVSVSMDILIWKVVQIEIPDLSLPIADTVIGSTVGRNR